VSGSSGPSVGGEGYSEESCSALRLQRVLEAPVPGVADGLTVDDILSVQLQDGAPPAVALLTAGGALAGSVVPTMRLLECLRQGNLFQAVVLSAAGGVVRIELRAAS